MRRFVGKVFRCNCWLYFFSLLLRGRLSGVIICWRTRLNLPHLIGVTKNGNFVHFKSLYTKERLAPLWFEGRAQVFRRASFDKTVTPSSELRTC